MRRPRSFFHALLSLVAVLAVAGCGGSSPNETLLPPPVIAEADAGQPAKPQAVLRIATVSPPVTTESGERATFTVTLSAKPEAPVVVPITSPNEAEIKVDPSALTFGPNDWDQPKTVTLIGQDEAVDDGDQTVLIGVGPTTSTEAHWNGVRSDGVSATNKDDDTAGVEISAPTPSASTTETGTKVTFTVRLKSQPAANVTIGISSSLPTEGVPDKTSLVFGPTDWQTPQTVTVTGQDDSAADDDKAYDIDIAKPSSTDAAYALISASKISLTNLDDDIPGFFVFPPATNQRFTTEAGGTTSFTVRLRSKPSADVTIPLSSTKTGEGSLGATTQLVFTTANFDQLQTVTVTGVDDKIDDDDQAYTITLAAVTSGDADYTGKDPPDVDLTNKDDDTAAIKVSAPSGTVTTEAGGAVTFTVELGSEPTAPVTLSVVSSMPGEGAVDKSELVFDATNWSTKQTVTVTGQDEKVDDNDQDYTIEIKHKVGSVTTDAKYAAIEPADVSLKNSDDDTLGVTVSGPRGGTGTTEGGGFVYVDILLKTQPTGDVKIPISISNTEAEADTAELTFTPDNWNVPQAVKITGKDDFIDDDDKDFTVITGMTMGGGYNVDPADITMKNQDDDTAAVIVSALSGTATELGGQVKFKVKLATRPAGTNQVSIPISLSPATGEANLTATLVPLPLVFTTGNYGTDQEVVVTGVGNGGIDLDGKFTIVIGAPVGDPKYALLNPPDFVDVPNVSACGNGVTNAGEGEACDDANASACDACDRCVLRQIVSIPTGSTSTVPAAALPAANGEMCIEMWARATGDSALASAYNDIVSDVGFVLRCAGGTTLQFFTRSDAVNVVIASGAASCGDGAWHHIAACREVDATDIKLHVLFDGTEVATAQGLVTNVGANTDITFGGTGGAFDEVRISSAARYKASFGTPPQRLTSDVDTRALWHLDEGTGAGKSVPNVYDFTLGGSSAWAPGESYSAACPP